MADHHGAPFADLRRLVAPRAVALAGASDRPSSLGHVAAANLLRHSRFDGDVHLVTDRYERVLGHPTVPSLDALPGPVDVVLLLLPREQVPEAVAAAERAGAGFAVVMSSGFGEAGDRSRGLELERQVVTIAARGAIRVVGPNCPGLADLARPLGLTIQPGFKDDLRAGGIGLVAQSGGLARCLLQASHRGVGFSYFFSVGNQVDLDIADFVHFLVQDEATEVIMLVMEASPSVERFQRVAAAARRRGKPIVLLKSGLSEAGRVAATSHTGALVGSRAAMEAVAARHGITVADDVADLVGTAAYLAAGRLPTGERAAVYGMSGGAGVLVADALEARGVELARLDASTASRLAPLTPVAGDVSNPVDLGAGAFAGDAFAEGLAAVAEDPGVGVVLVPLNAWYEGHTERFADACVAVAGRSSTPIVPVWMSPRRTPEIARLDAAGLPPCASVSEAAALTRALLAERAVRSRPSGGAPSLDGRVTDAGGMAARILAPGPADELRPGVHTEAEVKALLRAAGVRTTRESVVTTLEEANAAASEIGYPVIAKILDAGLPHRAGTGLVSGRIDDPHDLKASWDRLLVAADRHRTTAIDRPVLVAEFVIGVVEAHVGVKRDPEWGPMLSIGLGGAWIEEIADIALVPAPAGRDEVEAALARTKLSRVMRRHGVAGTAAGRLVDAAERIGALVAATPRIRELEVNPVILGDDAVVADALMICDDLTAEADV